MTELPIQQLLLDAVAVVKRLRLPYAVMGGMAVRVWGVPRPTYDADIAVVVDQSSLQNLLRSLEAAGFDVPAEHAAGFLDVIAGMQKVKVTRFAEGAVWDVDLFVANTPHLRSALKRRRSSRIDKRPIYVMAPEDLVILKLVANRPKDVADAHDILGLCPEIDVPYLRRWAARMDVANSLERLLRTRP